MSSVLLRAFSETFVAVVPAYERVSNIFVAEIVGAPHSRDCALVRLWKPFTATTAWFIATLRQKPQSTRRWTSLMSTSSLRNVNPMVRVRLSLEEIQRSHQPLNHQTLTPKSTRLRSCSRLLRQVQRYAQDGYASELSNRNHHTALGYGWLDWCAQSMRADVKPPFDSCNSRRTAAHLRRARDGLT